MRRDERGYTLVELLVVVGVSALLGSAVAMTVIQIASTTDSNQAHLITVSQVQSAGFWIGRDAVMSESVTVSDLTPPDFLKFKWTEQDFDGGGVTYHTITYSFQNVVDGVGDLKRNHWSDAGANDDTYVAKHIYYDVSVPLLTSNASYSDPVLNLRLRSSFGNITETRLYSFVRRPDFAAP